MKNKLTPIVLHARDEDELNVLKGAFNFAEAGLKPTTIVFGLSADTQVELAVAAKMGTPIYTTGLPTDVAAKLGTVTQIRAWKSKQPGMPNGCRPPVTYGVLEIKDNEAYKRLLDNADFKAALGLISIEDETEVPL